MRCSFRFALSGLVLLIIPLLTLKSRLQDLWNQYNVASYISHSWRYPSRYGTVVNNSVEPSDKVIIMAKLEKENTDWVTEHLSEYVLFELNWYIY